MKEFGASVSIGKDRSILVFYLPLSYSDWTKYTDTLGGVDPDPASVRYIFEKYITRAHLTEGDTTTEITPHNIALEGPAVVEVITKAMGAKSGFGNIEQFKKTLTDLELKSRTLMGAYDYFIFVHLGMESYMQCLDMDITNRAQIIIVLEKHTGISVSSRFDDSLNYNIPLDLIEENDKYENGLRQMMKKGKIDRGPKRRPKQTMPEGTTQTQVREPADRHSMIDASRSALEQEMTIANKNKELKERHFNWSRDEQSISKFEKTQEKEMFDKEAKANRENVGSFAFGNAPKKEK